MEVPCARLSPRLSWVLCLLLAGGSPALAAPYYTATDLGDFLHIQVTNGLNGQDVWTNTDTGVSHAFAFPWPSLTPLTQDQMKHLPGVSVYTGVSNPTLTYFSMSAQGANVQGTVIGSVPSGELRGSPQVDPSFGYTLPDGKGGYGPFVGLTQTVQGWPAPTGTWVQLNNQNQILIQDVSSGFADLTYGR